MKVGYCEGITAGKEPASQEGFDAGFADTGAPIGRELGIPVGYCLRYSLYFVYQCYKREGRVSTLADAQEISSHLSKIRFSDIMPRDLEAEEHFRQHLEEGVEIDVHGIEDMVANLAATNLVVSLLDRLSMMFAS